MTGVQYPVFWINTAVIIILPSLAFLLSGLPLSFEIPVLKGFNFRGGLHMSPELAALTFALGIYTAAFIAEIVRAGILAIDKGQREAAESIGLKPSKVMNLVILPQAIKNILPAIGNQFVYVLKMSSLVSIIGIGDLTRKANELVVTTYRPLEIYTFLILEYLVLILIVSYLVRKLEKKCSQ